MSPEYFYSSELHKSLGGNFHFSVPWFLWWKPRSVSHTGNIGCGILLGSDKCPLANILVLPGVSWCLMCATGPVVLCCFPLWGRWYLTGLRSGGEFVLIPVKGGIAVRFGVCGCSSGQSDFAFFLHVSISELCCGR